MVPFKPSKNCTTGYDRVGTDHTGKPFESFVTYKPTQILTVGKTRCHKLGIVVGTKNKSVAVVTIRALPGPESWPAFGPQQRLLRPNDDDARL